VPVLKAYRHGLTAGTPPTVNTHQRAPRGEVTGWSVGATRRNTAFLMSIRDRELTGAGVAFTLTLRDCPASPDEWHRLRRAWLKRMERRGYLRLHWVTEWQRRGVPHLHGAIWFPDGYDFDAIRDAWVAVASGHGAGHRGQFCRVIDGPVGWFQYLAKHASRGVQHYQRSADSIPPAWQGKTGRVWGHTGDWPVDPAMRINLEGSDGDRGYFAFRRMVRSWRLADARQWGDARRIVQARGMLRCPERALSEVRGVSEWVSVEGTLALVANLGARGDAVSC